MYFNLFIYLQREFEMCMQPGQWNQKWPSNQNNYSNQQQQHQQSWSSVTSSQFGVVTSPNGANPVGSNPAESLLTTNAFLKDD